MNFFSPSPVPALPISTTPSLLSPRHTKHTARLRLLQEYDRSRLWKELTDRRLCLLCDAEFDGSAIRISVRQGKPVFQCPQAHCQASLPHFVHPGNPLLNEDTWEDWMRPLPTGPGTPQGVTNYQFHCPAAAGKDSEPGAAASLTDCTDSAGSLGASVASGIQACKRLS